MKEYIYGNGPIEAERLARQTASEAPFLLNVMNLAGIRPGQKIFDFASGNGSVTSLLAHLVGPNGHVTGIEIDPKKVIIAQQQTQKSKIPNASYIQGDVLQPLNLTQQTDVAWSNYVAAHLGEEGTLQMVKNMKQSVKNNGTVAIHDITRWEFRGIPEELNAQFRQIWETAKSLYGVDAAIGTKLDSILKQAGLQNIKRYNLTHNSFTGKIPPNIIEDWEMRLSAPGIRNSAIKALGPKKAASFTGNFLQWMNSDNPNKHIHTETVLVTGTK